MTRTRSTVSPGPTIKLVTNGSVVGTHTLPGVSEQIEDMTHDLSTLGGADCGGPMLLNRNSQYHSPVQVTGGTRSGSQYYIPAHVGTLRPAIETDDQIKGSGTTAIARSAPTNPIFSGATVLGEAVSGGLPALAGVSTWKERTALSRGAGSEYLNYQFGWVPLVNDVRSLAYAVRNSDKILRDFHAGSGKNTRVGYRFPGNKSSYASNATVRSVRANGITGEFLPGGFTESSGSESWFSGCFTYYVPAPTSQKNEIARFAAEANKLLGVRITPDVLWNLTPWSWAMDWFGNYGDVLKNVSALGSDGLVLKYGYVMYHNYSETNIWQQAGSVNGIQYSGGSCRRVSEVKKRFGASPYSLFAAGTSLSAKQTAILGALGLSHRR